jgi:hypothetical protein
MKKLLLLTFVSLFAFISSAQVFVENFATATINGNVEGYNGWYTCLKAADAVGVSPKIGEGALFYTGYAGSEIGNVAILDPAVGETSATQHISTHTIIFEGNDTLKPAIGTKLYAAFLVNFANTSYTSYRDFFTFEGSKTSSSTRGRIFAKYDATTEDMLLAVSKNSSSAGVYVESSTLTGLTLDPGINHLLVLCYEWKDGDSNDEITLYINPDLTKTEAEQTNKLVATDAQTDYSLTSMIGINLRQRGIAAQIGGIRVGTAWSNVLVTGLSTARLSDASVSSFGKTVKTDGSGQLALYNLLGKEVLSARTNGQLETSLNNGLYIARFTGDDGNTTTGKVRLF